MTLRETIKYLSKDLLCESVESTLKKQKNLTDEQRAYLVELFTKYPHLWNGSLLPSAKVNKGELTWDDFKDIIAQAGKSKSAAKKTGIVGITEGKDYIYLGEGSNEKIGNYLMYQPLTYKGSKVLASNNVEPKKGNGAKWCVAYQKSYEYWRKYSFEYNCKFIYLMTKNTKYAIAVYPNKVEVFTFEDKNLRYPAWCKNDEFIQKAMKELKEPQPLKYMNLEDCIVKNQDGTLSLSLVKKGIYLEDGEYNFVKKSIHDIIEPYIKNGRLTVKFKEWDWDFRCPTDLISLEGCPDYVKGNFTCSFCSRLSSLEGAPERVGGEFDCSSCDRLTSLEGAPERVGGEFDCSSCDRLTSLEGAPKEVGGNFRCNFCISLSSLEGAPERVGGSFLCNNCRSLTSLEGAPKEVGGSFLCGECNKLISLEGAPERVGGDFKHSCCRNLLSLRGAPKEIGGKIYSGGCPKLNKSQPLKEEVLLLSKN